MDPEFAMAHIKVEVYNSSSSYYERSSPLPTDKTLLVSLATDLLKALADPTPKFHHLLSPLLPLLSSIVPFEPSHHTSAKRHREYAAENATKLFAIAHEIRERFSHTPLVLLIVDAGEKRWADTSPILGMENTAIIKKPLMEVLALQTPEARLFSFLVVYHEFGHLFEQWHNHRRRYGDFRQKAILPLDSLMQSGTVWGHAGAFIEWASMGGVSHWDDKGLFLHVAPQQIRRITSEQAQQWWDSGFYHHIVWFLDDCEVQNSSGLCCGGDGTEHPCQPTPFRDWDSIICSNMRSVQHLEGEDETTWVARVYEKSEKEYSMAIPAAYYRRDSCVEEWII